MCFYQEIKHMTNLLMCFHQVSLVITNLFVSNNASNLMFIDIKKEISQVASP